MRTPPRNNPMARLELTVRSRTRNQFDNAITTDLDRLSHDVLDRRRRVGHAADALAAAISPHALAGIELVSLERGVLTVRARSSSARFIFDRELRSGGKERLLRASASAIKRIKVETATPKPTP